MAPDAAVGAIYRQSPADPPLPPSRGLVPAAASCIAASEVSSQWREAVAPDTFPKDVTSDAFVSHSWPVSTRGRSEARGPVCRAVESRERRREARRRQREEAEARGRAFAPAPPPTAPGRYMPAFTAPSDRHRAPPEETDTYVVTYAQVGARLCWWFVGLSVAGGRALPTALTAAGGNSLAF
jgi:hypothetical protein